MWHAWERGETCKGFWWESLKERDHLKDQGVDESMGLEWILRIWEVVEWLWTGTVGELS
jgi:hypothetical protein